MLSQLNRPESRSAAADAAIVLEPSRTSLDLEAFLLPEGRHIIGSGEDADIVIDVEGVDPRHCLILVGKRHAVVKSWSPKTWINEGPAHESALRPGDRLQVGPVEFRVRAQTPGERLSQADDSLDSAELSLRDLEELLHESRLANQSAWGPELSAVASPLDEDRNVLSARQQECEERERRLAARESRLLTAQVDVERRKSELVRRDTELHALQISIQQQQQELHAAHAELDRRLCECADLERASARHTEEAARALAEAARIADASRSEGEFREAELLGRESGLADKTAALADRLADIESRERTAADRETELHDREQGVHIRLEEAARRWSEIESQESSLVDRADDLARRQEDAARREAALSASEEELAARRRELDEAVARNSEEQAQQRITADEREVALRRQGDELLARERQLGELADELLARGADLDSRQQQFDVQQATNAARAEEHLRREEELAARDQTLEMRSRMLDDRELELSRLAAQVDRDATRIADGSATSAPAADAITDVATGAEADVATDSVAAALTRSVTNAAAVADAAEVDALRRTIAELEARLDAQTADVQRQQENADESHRQLAAQWAELESTRAALVDEKQAIQAAVVALEQERINGLAAPAALPQDWSSAVDTTSSVEEPLSGDSFNHAAPEAWSSLSDDPAQARFDSEADRFVAEEPAADVSHVADPSEGRIDEISDSSDDVEASRHASLESTPELDRIDAEGETLSTEEEEPEDVQRLRSQLADLFGISPNELSERAHDHDGGDVPLADLAIAEVEPDVNVPVAGEPAAPDATLVDAASPATAVEDDSVAHYMQRLLARNGLNRGHEPAPPPPVQEARPQSAVVDRPAAAEREVPKPSDPAEEPRPGRKTLKPEEKQAIRQNIDSFRELANLSARSAVARHHVQKLRLTVQVKLMLAVFCGIAATVLLSWEIFGGVPHRWEGSIVLLATLIASAEYLRTRMLCRRLCRISTSGSDEEIVDLEELEAPELVSERPVAALENVSAAPARLADAVPPAEPVPPVVAEISSAASTDSASEVDYPPLPAELAALLAEVTGRGASAGESPSA